MRGVRRLLTLSAFVVFSLAWIAAGGRSAGASTPPGRSEARTARSPAAALALSSVPLTTTTSLNAVSTVPGTSFAWAVGSTYNSETRGIDTVIERFDGTKWRLAKSPNPNFGNNQLLGVAATSPTDAWAVGLTSGVSAQEALVVRYDGTEWGISPTPTLDADYVALNAIAAVSSTDVWAVGAQQTDLGPDTLLEHWDGASWTEMDGPDPGPDGGRLLGVSAFGPADVWAVGEAYTPNGSTALVEHFDGAQWSVVDAPSPGVDSTTLRGVVALSPTDVWAVGDFFGTSGHEALVEHFDGGEWTRDPGPPGSQAWLTGIAGGSSTGLWASGYRAITEGTTATEVEHYDGQAWSTLSTPNPGSLSNALNAVAVADSGTVWSVGSARHANDMEVSLVEADAGAGWAVVASPNLRGSVLRGVSGSSRTDVWAVGASIDPRTGGGRTLAEHWDGTGWSIADTPTAGGSAILSAVTSLSATDAWAVGSYLTQGGTVASLALHLDEGAWGYVPLPDTGNSSLAAVAAAGPEDVWAVGATAPGFFATMTMIQHWDGSTWSVLPSPSPGVVNQLNGLAVVASDDVWAVGSYSDGGPFGDKTLTEHWDGTSWTVVPSPNPAQLGNRLVAATALGSGQVFAVGSRTGEGFDFLADALAEQYNGTRWAASTTPTFPTENGLSSVAVSPSTVWAVGGLFDEQGNQRSLIERRTGSGWTRFASPSPGARANELLGVAALPTGQVWAVGRQTGRASGVLTLIEVFDGSRWRVVESRNR